MTLLNKIFLTSALIGLSLYLFQILMIFGCCDKYIKLQVNVFRATMIAMVIAIISFIISVFVK